jgi:hypothetical protein
MAGRNHGIPPFGVGHALVPYVEDIGKRAERPAAKSDAFLDVEIRLIDGG